jgi:hypothetical protein
MLMWHEAADAMAELDRESEEMTVDQRLKLAEIKALLAIGQELSMIHTMKGSTLSTARGRSRRGRPAVQRRPSGPLSDDEGQTWSLV